jgi:hypothetical protein
VYQSALLAESTEGVNDPLRFAGRGGCPCALSASLAWSWCGVSTLKCSIMAVSICSASDDTSSQDAPAVMHICQCSQHCTPVCDVPLVRLGHVTEGASPSIAAPCTRQTSCQSPGGGVYR